MPLAVKRITAQPCAFTAGQLHASNMIKLFAQFALVNLIGQTQFRRPVNQRKLHTRIRFVAKHRLAHQQFIKVGVDQGPDNRIDLPFMVPDPRGDIDHDLTL